MIVKKSLFVALLLALLATGLPEPSAHAGQRVRSGGSSRSSGGFSRSSVSRSGGTTAKSRASRASRASSGSRFSSAKKAIAPPKSTYKSPTGRTVKVPTKSAAVSKIRSKPAREYEPARRRERTTTHVERHHYSHPTSWHHAQPTFFVGGGYSSPFWYMMMEWNANRRAERLYHHRSTIDQSAYERGAKDAEVQARIAALEASGTPPDDDYVDPEFSDNPDLMYEQEFVEAAYNAPAPPSGYSGWWIFVTVVGVTVCGSAFFALLYLSRP